MIIQDVVVGIDVVSVRRFEQLLQRFGSHLLKQVFTEYEQAHYGQSVLRLAARFSAKEAVSKAMQVGLDHMSSDGLSSTDIEIRTLSNGAPSIFLYRKAQQLANDMDIRAMNISLSHDKSYAIAMVTGIRYQSLDDKVEFNSL